MLWQLAASTLWAMVPSSLDSLLTIASRQHDPETLRALETRLGQRLEHSYQVTVRDRVAMIPVAGPLFRYANLFTRISGATSYEVLAQDITHVLDSDEVDALILVLDSPGGEVNGCAELASLIFEARGQKPIAAYVSGDAASGAYWIASACDEIIVSSTSGLGSIGVVGTYRSQEDVHSIEIVSSQSPFKRLDIAVDEDRQRLQDRMDALASVFVQSVANYRSVSVDTVLEHFGQGDVLIGQTAVNQGLADRLGSLESTLQTLVHTASDQSSSSTTDTRSQEVIMTDTDSTTKISQSQGEVTDQPMTDDAESRYQSGQAQGLAHGLQQGAERERERIGAILQSKEANGRETLAQHFAFQTAMDVSAAIAALSVAPRQNAPSSGFEAMMATIENPVIEPASDTDLASEADTTTAMAERIAGLTK